MVAPVLDTRTIWHGVASLQDRHSIADRSRRVALLTESLAVVGEFTFDFLVVLPFEHARLNECSSRLYWRTTE